MNILELLTEEKVSIKEINAFRDKMNRLSNNTKPITPFTSYKSAREWLRNFANNDKNNQKDREEAKSLLAKHTQSQNQTDTRKPRKEKIKDISKHIENLEKDFNDSLNPLTRKALSRHKLNLDNLTLEKINNLKVNSFLKGSIRKAYKKYKTQRLNVELEERKKLYEPNDENRLHIDTWQKSLQNEELVDALEKMGYSLLDNREDFDPRSSNYDNMPTKKLQSIIDNMRSEVTEKANNLKSKRLKETLENVYGDLDNPTDLNAKLFVEFSKAKYLSKIDLSEDPNDYKNAEYVRHIIKKIKESNEVSYNEFLKKNKREVLDKYENLQSDFRSDYVKKFASKTDNVKDIDELYTDIDNLTPSQIRKFFGDKKNYLNYMYKNTKVLMNEYTNKDDLRSRLFANILKNKKNIEVLKKMNGFIETLSDKELEKNFKNEFEDYKKELEEKEKEENENKITNSEQRFNSFRVKHPLIFKAFTSVRGIYDKLFLNDDGTNIFGRMVQVGVEEAFKLVGASEDVYEPYTKIFNLLNHSSEEAKEFSKDPNAWKEKKVDELEKKKEKLLKDLEIKYNENKQCLDARKQSNLLSDHEYNVKLEKLTKKYEKDCADLESRFKRSIENIKNITNLGSVCLRDNPILKTVKHD